MAWALYITPTARPDALVTLCYLGALAWTEREDASPASAAAAGALAALAFYVKPYGVVAGVFGAASLAMRRQWKLAGILLVVQGAVWLVLAWLIRRAHPLYFEEVFLVNSNIAGGDAAHRWSQWMELLPLILAPLALIGVSLALSRRALGQALCQPWVPVLALSVLLFHLKLSLHTGARLTYFMQLSFPLLLLAAGQLWRGPQRPAWALPAAFAVAGLLLALKLQVGAYQSIAVEDATARSIGDALAPRYYSAGGGHSAWWIWSQGGVLFDAGQGEFAHYAEPVPAWGTRFFTHSAALKARRERFEAGMARAVAQGRFGRIGLGGQSYGPIEAAAAAQAQPMGRAILSTPQIPYLQTDLLVFQPRATKRGSHVP